MTVQEAIAQLESLKDHCAAMILEHGCVWKEEHGCVWKEDVKALEMAMEIMREQV